jgi:hypothetical protein
MYSRFSVPSQGPPQTTPPSLYELRRLGLDDLRTLLREQIQRSTLEDAPPNDIQALYKRCKTFSEVLAARLATSAPDSQSDRLMNCIKHIEEDLLNAWACSKHVANQTTAASATCVSTGPLNPTLEMLVLKGAIRDYADRIAVHVQQIDRLYPPLQSSPIETVLNYLTVPLMASLLCLPGAHGEGHPAVTNTPPNESSENQQTDPATQLDRIDTTHSSAGQAQNQHAISDANSPLNDNGQSGPSSSPAPGNSSERLPDSLNPNLREGPSAAEIIPYVDISYAPLSAISDRLWVSGFYGRGPNGDIVRMKRQAIPTDPPKSEAQVTLSLPRLETGNKVLLPTPFGFAPYNIKVADDRGEVIPFKIESGSIELTGGTDRPGKVIYDVTHGIENNTFPPPRNLNILRAPNYQSIIDTLKANPSTAETQLDTLSGLSTYVSSNELNEIIAVLKNEQTTQKWVNLGIGDCDAQATASLDLINQAGLQGLIIVGRPETNGHLSTAGHAKLVYINSSGSPCIYETTSAMQGPYTSPKFTDQERTTLIRLADNIAASNNPATKLEAYRAFREAIKQILSAPKFEQYRYADSSFDLRDRGWMDRLLSSNWLDSLTASLIFAVPSVTGLSLIGYLGLKSLRRALEVVSKATIRLAMQKLTDPLAAESSHLSFPKDEGRQKALNYTRERLSSLIELVPELTSTLNRLDHCTDLQLQQLVLYSCVLSSFQIGDADWLDRLRFIRRVSKNLQPMKDRSLSAADFQRYLPPARGKDIQDLTERARIIVDAARKNASTPPSYDTSNGAKTERPSRKSQIPGRGEDWGTPWFVEPGMPFDAADVNYRLTAAYGRPVINTHFPTVLAPTGPNLDLVCDISFGQGEIDLAKVLLETPGGNRIGSIRVYFLGAEIYKTENLTLSDKPGQRHAMVTSIIKAVLQKDEQLSWFSRDPHGMFLSDFLWPIVGLLLPLAAAAPKKGRLVIGASPRYF